MSGRAMRNWNEASGEEGWRGKVIFPGSNLRGCKIN